MKYMIRKMAAEEYPLLEEFLYQAIFVPEGVEPPPRSITDQPELQVYIRDFGSADTDRALVAVCGDKIVGAVWTRIMDDYGHIDDDTPSFAISLLPEYRGHGIGTALMRAMLSVLSDSGIKKASLAVQKANYAVRMYRSVGFEVIDENEEEYIMSCELNGFTIRKMTINDYEEVYALWLSCSGMGLNDVDDSREGIARFLERNPDTCFVAVINEKIIGVIIAGNDGRRGYIYHTAVSPDHRGRGIARALVKNALDALEKCGITKVALVVFKRNETGNAFWEKIGFTGRDDLNYRNCALREMTRIDT